MSLDLFEARIATVQQEFGHECCVPLDRLVAALERDLDGLRRLMRELERLGRVQRSWRRGRGHLSRDAR